MVLLAHFRDAEIATARASHYPLPRALALAAQLVALPAVALRLVKESVLMAMETPLAAGLAFERAAFQTTFATADKHEGMRARLDKRAAKFEGR